MNGPIKTLALILAVAAPASLAAQTNVTRGLYEAPTCQTPQSSSIVRVSSDRLRFFESSCSVHSPQPVPGMANAYTYSAYCSGEGEQASFSTTYTIQEIPNGLILTQADGPGFTYTYCGQ